LLRQGFLQARSGKPRSRAETPVATQRKEKKKTLPIGIEKDEKWQSSKPKLQINAKWPNAHTAPLE
jgi:hypothetical protein